MTLLKALPEEVREPVEGYQPERVPWAEVEVVGQAGGKDWLKRRRGGALLRVERLRTPAEEGNPWRRGTVCVVRSERRTIEGMGLPGGRGHPTVLVEHLVEATPATAEDYAAAQAADQAKAEAKARKVNPMPAPADALARYAFLRGRRGGAQMVEAFVQRDIGLRLVGGKLVPVPLVPTKRIAPDEGDAVAAASPLMLPWLRDGTEPPGPAKHKGTPPVAVMVVVDGVTLCEPHAIGAVSL